MVEGVGAGDAVEPGAIVVGDGVGHDLAARERVVVVRVVHLQITGAHGHAIERGGGVGVGIGVEISYFFTRQHRLRPDPGANFDRQRCLHVEVYLRARGKAHRQQTATGTVYTLLLRHNGYYWRG